MLKYTQVKDVIQCQFPGDIWACPAGRGVRCGQLDPSQPIRAVEEAHHKVNIFLLGVLLLVPIATLEIAGFGQ